MAETAAAPVAAPVTNGAASQTTTPAVAIKPTPGPGAVRGPDGKFVAAGGAVPAPAAEPEWRYKDKLKLSGQEKEVDYTRDEVRSRLQKADALERRAMDANKKAQQAERLFELAQNDPDEFLKQLGKDPDDWATKRLAARARLGAMTPEERSAHDAKQEAESYKAKLAAYEQKEAAAKTQAEQNRLVKQHESQFLPALDLIGLPKTYETLFLMAETAKIGLEDGQEYTPAELAKETERRADIFAERFLGGLDGKGLIKRLGTARIQAILEATIADHELQAGQTYAGNQPAPPREEPKEREYIDEAELNRRMRLMRTGGR